MLSDIPAHLRPIDKVLQSLVGFVHSKMTRDGVSVEIIQKLHPDAGRYVKLVYGLVWECGNTVEEILHYGKLGICVDAHFTVLNHLLIKDLPAALSTGPQWRWGNSFDVSEEAVMMVAHTHTHRYRELISCWGLGKGIWYSVVNSFSVFYSKSEFLKSECPLDESSAGFGVFKHQ